MTKSFALILSLLVIGACSKSPSRPSGVTSLDKIRSLAEGFVLRGDVDAIRKHTDLTGVPQHAAENLNVLLNDWHGVPATLKLTNTQIMSFADYETLDRDDRKDLPDDMREALRSPTQWNVRPEKMIVFNFVSQDPKDTSTRVRWCAGAYKTNGLWFFAAGYNDEDPSKKIMDWSLKQ